MSDELIQAVDDACERLIAFLKESNVPELQLEPIRELMETHDGEEILERAEELGNCLAFMRHDRLVGGGAVVLESSRRGGAAAGRARVRSTSRRRASSLTRL